MAEGEYEGTGKRMGLRYTMLKAQRINKKKANKMLNIKVKYFMYVKHERERVDSSIHRTFTYDKLKTIFLFVKMGKIITSLCLFLCVALPYN